MPSIVIRLDAALLEDPDLDLRYEIPDLLAARAPGVISDDGYDYGDDDVMLIFVGSTDNSQALPLVIQLLENDRLHGNHLAAAAVVGVSEKPAKDSESFRVVFPEEDGTRIDRESGRLLSK